jgi:hypothetical protein
MADADDDDDGDDDDRGNNTVVEATPPAASHAAQTATQPATKSNRPSLLLVLLAVVSLVAVPLLAVVTQSSPRGYPAEYVAELVHNKSKEALFPEELARLLAAMKKDEPAVPDVASSAASLVDTAMAALQPTLDAGMEYFTLGVAQLMATVNQLTATAPPTNATANATAEASANTTTAAPEVAAVPVPPASTVPETPPPVPVPEPAPAPAFDRHRLLKGITAIVTGSTSGLGKQIATELYRYGAHVVVASRNRRKCRLTIREIRRQHNATGAPAVGRLEVGVLDTSDLDSVAAFAKARCFEAWKAPAWPLL